MSKRQVYNVVYNGLDKETRIDCLAQIRQMQNPTGYTVLDIDGLAKSTRSTKEDAKNCKEPRTPGKFVRIDLNLDENLNPKTTNPVKQKKL